MADSITIEVKGVPPSLNVFAGRANSWDYRKTKQKWTWAVKAACLACKGRPKQPYEKAVVEITYFFPDQRRRDADNYAGKFLLDGLTQAKVIVDDDLKHITTIIKGNVDKHDPRTQITITRVGE